MKDEIQLKVEDATPDEKRWLSAPNHFSIKTARNVTHTKITSKQ